MKLWRQPLGPIQTNCYVISTEAKQAIIFDPGMDPQPLLDYVADLNVQAIILTHAHFDHIGGLEEVRSQTGAPVYIHSEEQHWLNSPEHNGSARWPMVIDPLVCKPAEYELQDAQTLNIAGVTMQIFHTPGHSPGSVSIYLPEAKLVIAVDTLFQGSVGRTDLPGGDFDILANSIKQKLFTLPEQTEVYPGHGEPTTIKLEKQFNPFVGGE